MVSDRKVLLGGLGEHSANCKEFVPATSQRSVTQPAIAFLSDGNRLLAISKSGAMVLRFCTSPDLTMTLISIPSVSTAVYSAFSLIFLPTPNPAESSLPRLSARLGGDDYRGKRYENRGMRKVHTSA